MGITAFADCLQSFEVLLFELWVKVARLWELRRVPAGEFSKDCRESNASDVILLRYGHGVFEFRSEAGVTDFKNVEYDNPQ